jgi:membrane associated rhomboid family serine protease
MGAYMVLYPRVRVHTAIPFGFYIRVIPLSAWVVLALWLGLQFVGSWLFSNVGGGVAYGAHIGGFVAGVVLIKPFERKGLVAAKLEHRVLTREERRDLGLWS